MIREINIKGGREETMKSHAHMRTTIITTIGNTMYELEPHDFGKRLDQIKIKKGWRLLMPWEAQRLWDMKLLIKFWIFVRNPLNNGNVARLNANSDGAGLICYGIASYSDSSLGVIFAKDLKEISKGAKK